MTSLTPLWNWIVANPYETLLLIGAVISFINGLLPAKVASGPVGLFFHALLDRLSALTRRDAPGTLKWPGVGTVLLQLQTRRNVTLPPQEPVPQEPVPQEPPAPEAAPVVPPEAVAPEVVPQEPATTTTTTTTVTQESTK